MIELPNISKWKTSNVISLEFLFAGCSKLKYLPDISKWEMDNIQYIDGMFWDCSSLLSLPDISKWNAKNIKNIARIFKGCSSLLFFPDISKWHLHDIYFIEKSLSNKSSSMEIKTIVNGTDNINSSSFLNKPEGSDLNKNKEYKVEDINFYKEDNTLTSFYDDFYS